MKTKDNKNLNLEGRMGSAEPIDFNSKNFKDHKATVAAEYESLNQMEKLKIELESLKQKINSYLESESSKMKHFDYFVELYLNVLGINQRDFATFLNYNHTNFNKVLKGKRPLSYNLAIKLANSLELDPKALLMIQMKNNLTHVKKSSQFNSDKLISFSLRNKKLILTNK